MRFFLPGKDSNSKWKKKFNITLIRINFEYPCIGQLQYICIGRLHKFRICPIKLIVINNVLKCLNNCV